MDRIAVAELAELLLSTPAWARLGLAVRNERMRHRAAEAVAAQIMRALEPGVPPHPDQFSLQL